jgi:DNA-binding Xre family transcriptional regulator
MVMPTLIKYDVSDYKISLKKVTEKMGLSRVHTSIVKQGKVKASCFLILAAIC